MNNYLRKISSDTSYKDEIDWCTEALRKAKLPEVPHLLIRSIILYQYAKLKNK